jgi:hypothetical protein
MDIEQQGQEKTRQKMITLRNEAAYGPAKGLQVILRSVVRDKWWVT